MKPEKHNLAHMCLENYIVWSKRKDKDDPRLGFPPCTTYYKLIKTDDHSSGEVLAEWFTDEWGLLINKALSALWEDRPFEFKLLMYYYFNNQRQDLTCQKFHINSPHRVDNHINAAVGYVEGMLRGYAA